MRCSFYTDIWTECGRKEEGKKCTSLLSARVAWDFLSDAHGYCGQEQRSAKPEQFIEEECTITTQIWVLLKSGEVEWNRSWMLLNVEKWKFYTLWYTYAICVNSVLLFSFFLRSSVRTFVFLQHNLKRFMFSSKLALVHQSTDYDQLPLIAHFYFYSFFLPFS